MQGYNDGPNLARFINVSLNTAFDKLLNSNETKAWKPGVQVLHRVHAWPYLFSFFANRPFVGCLCGVSVWGVCLVSLRHWVLLNGLRACSRALSAKSAIQWTY